MHAFNHASIFRAIYIHGADYEPDFLSHLVVFALRLRNAGISDRGNTWFIDKIFAEIQLQYPGLIVYLSDYLAGNVYGFGTQGHQVIYEDLNTYT